jgi:hypothetical protein
MLNLSLQERVLAYAGYHQDENAVNAYQFNQNGVKILQKVLNESLYIKLIESYRKDPKGIIAYFRSNIFNLLEDKTLSEKELNDRLIRYIESHFSLICKLDSDTYPNG